jgi:DNA-binding response OmpR family regulator
MMTTLMTPDVTTRALELGASQVLQKPIELDALAALVLEGPGAKHPSPPATRGD